MAYDFSLRAFVMLLLAVSFRVASADPEQAEPTAGTTEGTPAPANPIGGASNESLRPPIDELAKAVEQLARATETTLASKVAVRAGWGVVFTRRSHMVASGSINVVGGHPIAHYDTDVEWSTMFAFVGYRVLAGPHLLLDVGPVTALGDADTVEYGVAVELSLNQPGMRRVGLLLGAFSWTSEHANFSEGAVVPDGGEPTTRQDHPAVILGVDWGW